MKILRIISFGFQGGGAETGVVEVDNLLREKGHTVIIVSSNAHPEKTHFSNYEFSAIDPNNPFKILLHIFNFSAYFTIKKVLKRYKPDIVHLHTMGEISPLVLFLFRHLPVVMTVHGPEFFLSDLLIWVLSKNSFKTEEISKDTLNLRGKINFFYFERIQGYIYKFALRNVDLFILFSKYMQDTVGKKLRPNVVISNGIQLLKYRELTYNHTLLYVGRLEKYKGIEYAIQSLPQIVKEYPDTVFLVAGEGAYKENLISLVEKMKLQNHVRFLGWIDHGKIEFYYEQASIIIMPSFWPEAFGKSGVEAMSKGRPVIASRVGGISEWLDSGKTGFLVDQKNPGQIAKYVTKLFGDKKLLLSMGKASRKKAENFSIEKYANNLEQIYLSFYSKT